MNTTPVSNPFRVATPGSHGARHLIGVLLFFGAITGGIARGWKGALGGAAFGGLACWLGLKLMWMGYPNAQKNVETWKV
jgi:hypothetical protein